VFCRRGVLMSQPWRLSQKANKKSGVCSSCQATRQIHFNNGTVHRHGPRDNPCPGSDKPPLGPSVSTTASGGFASASPASRSGVVSSAPTGPSISQQSLTNHFTWSPAEGGIIKHIPKSARTSCANHLSGILKETTAHPQSSSSWLALFQWAKSILAVPIKAGEKQNLTSLIIKRTTPSATPVVTTSGVEPPGIGRKSAPSSLAKTVASKLEDGNMKAAIRLLVSEDSFTPPSDAVLSSLQEKHPPSSLDEYVLPLPDQSLSPVVSEDAVKKAIASFPAGSAGGPDGLSPQHLKVLVGSRIAGPDLLTAITGFINMILSGQCPSLIAKSFFGGRLLALSKKSGGIRPIVIGFTLRRLASKLANAFGLTSLANYFSPRQLGAGQAGGCEAAIHSARRYLENMQEGKVLLKLDFSNAFNSLHRGDMLLAVKDRLPELYPYIHSSYSSPASLHFGSSIINSNEGAQQGDPIGPLLFCITVQPLLQSLKSELTLGYLDDLTLAGDQHVAAEDVERITAFGSQLGLSLNVSKCEIITHSNTVVTEPLLQSFIRVEMNNASLLGAPLFKGPALDKAWDDRCEDMTRAAGRLKLVGSQDALLLLRASFGAPRVQHLLRCSLSVDHPNLISFDSIQRNTLEMITNASLSDIHWLQASLPIKEGGLGIRRVTPLALASFISSAISTTTLQENILASCPSAIDAEVLQLSARWSALYGPAPSGPAACKQVAWNLPIIAADKALILSDLHSPRQKAVFLAAAAPHTGAWLSTLPIANCGLRLDDEAIRVAVALRLGLQLCQPHDCRCGAPVDVWGTHALVCKKAGGRTTRHFAINDLIYRAIVSAGIPVSKEPSGTIRGTALRPDGITLVPWRGGRALAWDATIASTLADSYVEVSSTRAGSASESAAAKKMVKYAGLSAEFSFQPIALESLGPACSSTAAFITDLGRRISGASGEPGEELFLWQRISICLQRYNAILLHQSFVEQSSEPDG
jgi:hypothetical protein